MNQPIQITEPSSRNRPAPQGFAGLALGFRPFFALGALAAAVLVPLWVLMLAGQLPLTPVVPGMLWHGHEMLFGFAGAIIGGFLLTATRTWTGLETPSGPSLMALVLLWLAGRLGFFFAGPVLSAVLDSAFLPVVALVLARVLLRSGNRRNYFAPGLLLALTAVNVIFHAGVHGWVDVSPNVGLHLAVALVTLLETVIAGRIVPSFTANALRTVPWRNLWVDRAAIVGTAMALFCWALAVGPWMTGVIAALTAALQAIRAWGWRPWATRATPLLWILHLGHAWIIVALALLAVSAAGLASPALVLHVLTVGATGGLIIAMITRTSLGHTGRLLASGRPELACYLLIQGALILRIVPQMVETGVWYMPLLWASALCWSTCFTIYLVRYLPVLMRPRVDGKPG